MNAADLSRRGGRKVNSKNQFITLKIEKSCNAQINYKRLLNEGAEIKAKQQLERRALAEKHKIEQQSHMVRLNRARRTYAAQQKNA